jgi:hypothetical protein
MEKPRLAITCGDPAGVGPELIIKCLSEMQEDEAHLSLIGPGYWLDEAVKACPFEVESIAVGLPSVHCEVGKPSPESSKIALEAMELEVALLESLTEWLLGQYRSLVALRLAFPIRDKPSFSRVIGVDLQRWGSWEKN